MSIGIGIGLIVVGLVVSFVGFAFMGGNFIRGIRRFLSSDEPLMDEEVEAGGLFGGVLGLFGGHVMGMIIMGAGAVVASVGTILVVVDLALRALM